MPPGTLVPRDWVLEQLPDGSPGVPAVEGPTPPARVDLTIRDVAKLFGKQPSTVRGWIERGDFPGAYKLHGKEWRVPPAGLDAFQRAQRARTATPQAGAKTDLAAWRSARRSQRGSHHDTER
jgi:transposase